PPRPTSTRGGRVSNSRVPHAASSASVVRSAVSYRLGGRDYPMRSEPKCETCQHEYRAEIERGLLRAYSPTSVWRSLPEKAQAPVSIKQIGTHARTHMPVDIAVRQTFIRERIEEIGRDYETAEGTLVDGI